MKRKLPIFYLFVLLASGIFGYNYWFYACGHCTAESFLTLSQPAILLIAGNLLALLVLVGLKLRTRRRLARKYCACGSFLLPSWQFCPDCGSALPG